MNSSDLTNIIYPPRKCWRIPPRTALLFGALFLTLAALPFHELIASRVFESGTLSNNSPPVDLVNEMVESSSHPEASILSAWQTGRLVHRRAAIFEVRRIVASTPSLSSNLQPLVLAAAFDPDLNVREDAFRVLRRCNKPELGAIAASQLRDCDPEIRILGLEYLRWISSDRGVPTVASMLHDNDPLVAAYASCLLGKWAQQNFGLKLTEVAPGTLSETSGLRDIRNGGQTKSATASKRAQTWLDAHRSEFTTAAITPSIPPLDMQPVEATDFEAPALDGHNVRLAEFRGKPVLLYFWTSHCPGGAAELQDLGSLHQKDGDNLAIIGVSLNNVHDDDGDLGGDDEDSSHKSRKQRNEPSSGDIENKLARAMIDNGVKFTTILDRDFSIGGKFNAVEMPTTVIIDAQGFVRRRFTGRRTLPVLEAMVTEASRPAAPPAKL